MEHNIMEKNTDEDKNQSKPVAYSKKSNQDNFKEYAKPMIIRSLFGSLMHTADRLIAAIFIGASALVATTLISPLMFVVAALAMFFITGLGAYVGLLIGKNKSEKAGQVSSGIILLMGVLGIILMLPAVFFSENFAYFLGARGIFFDLSVQYLQIFALSFPFLLVGRGLDVLILNDGSPGYSFKLNIVTAVSNLLLNIIAVVFLGWGIKGLAIATLISTIIEFAGGGWYFLKRSKIIHLTRPSFELRTLLRIAYNGISEFAMMSVEAVMVFVINIAFVNFLSPAHFEAYAAVNIILMMFYSIYLGASMGLQPLLSQMMGRKEFTTLKSLIKFSVNKALIYGLVVYILIIPVSGHILKLFLKDAVALEYAKYFYLTIGLATLFSNYPLQMSMFFTAINRPLESALISCMRTLICIPPLVYMFIKVSGASGVALGFIAADVIMIIGLLVFMKNLDISTLKVYD